MIASHRLRYVTPWEPILERQFAKHRYGFRPYRGRNDALRRVDGLVKRGLKCTVDVDLKSYFDTIPHDRLIAELRKYVADNRVIGLVEHFLQADILGGMDQWKPTAGAPQGAIISPLLSNLYLNDLDLSDGRVGLRDDPVRQRPGDSVCDLAKKPNGHWRWCKRGPPSAV